MDIELQVKHAVMDGIRDGVKAKLASSYDSPLSKLLVDVISKHDAEFRKLLDCAIASCIADDSFRDEVRSGVRHSLAKLLVSRFGGELEKHVNALKSDPATRARITLAIEEIVKVRQ